MVPNTPEYLDSAEVSRRLRLGNRKKTAEAFFRAAEGRGAFKLNGKWRISNSDFEFILEELKTKPYRLLLVENDPEEVLRFSEAFERSRIPIRPTVAVDGNAALVCIRARVPDLVIIDLAVVGMTGIDLLREIQPLHLPTLIYSSASNASPIRQALELGAVDCILKGTQTEHGLDAIDEFIRSALG